jgi:hypothetical protein
MNITRIVVVLLLVALANPIFAQTKKQSSNRVADLEKEVARLQAELTACQNAKKAVSNTQRTEAIASIRAIRSALSTGANLQEFKKYQIESRIKIDALPAAPENRILKEISDLYADAVSFSITGVTGRICSSELEAARIKYRGNERLIKALDGMTPDVDFRGFQQDMNRIEGDAMSQYLILMAYELSSKLE